MHGSIPPERFFAYLTWKDIEGIEDKERAVIVQPIGAVEQHGPHLPLAVDAMIGPAVLGRALRKFEPEIPVYVLPPLSYGKSNEHLHFPGTISLSANTLISLLMDVGESVYRAGFRKWVLMNSHGGQPQVVEIVARDLHVKFPDFLLFPLSTWRVPNACHTVLTPKENELGIHAGDAETSVMLAVMPEQVRMDKAAAEYPTGVPNKIGALLSMEGDLQFAWVTRDLSSSGVIGDPTTATREKGEIILETLAEGWARVLVEVYHFKQPQA